MQICFPQQCEPHLDGVDEDVGGRVDGEKKMVHLTKEKNVKRRVSMSSLSRNVVKILF